MSRNITLLFLLLSGLTVGQLSHGLASDASKPVTIDADRATSNGISGVTTYSGNVLVKQGSMSLKADSVTLITKKNKVTSIKASGKRVTLSQRPSPSEAVVTASARNITYNIQQQTAELRGNARLQQSGRELSSGLITYDFKKKLVNAKSQSRQSSTSRSGRVHVVIPPANKE